MTDAGFVAAAYLVPAGVIGAYVVALVRRGRRLAERVPADRRRWM